MFFIDPYRHAAPETDPYYANVVLLLHGEGANGAQVFTDSGPLGLVPSTITGSVQTSTSQKEYGTSSIYSPGPASPGNAFRYTPGGGPFAFGTGDFTIELSVYDQSTVSGNNGILCTRASFAENGWLIERYAGAFLYTNADDVYWAVPVAASTWTKIAFSRVSGVTYSFVNGVLQESKADTSNNSVASFLYMLKLGWINGNYAGYIDEVRITKGVGRYTASYTPRTTPFPDF